MISPVVLGEGLLTERSQGGGDSSMESLPSPNPSLIGRGAPCPSPS